MTEENNHGKVEFQPTRPLRGATASQLSAAAVTRISTHAPLAGRDQMPVWSVLTSVLDFNPRAPCGARPAQMFVQNLPCQFQPTRPLRGATGRGGHPEVPAGISTHAPLAGRDSLLPKQCSGHQQISTHAPLAGRDGYCGLYVPSKQISTHAPLAGRDKRHRCRRIPTTVFQPTRPLRGATAAFLAVAINGKRISTHAPLAGRDYNLILIICTGFVFQPTRQSANTPPLPTPPH